MRKAAYIFCVVLAAGCLLYAGVWFITGRMQKGKDSRLAEQFHSAAAPVEPADYTPATDTHAADKADVDTAMSRFGPLAGINPDLIGWISIEGTAIDYPVVRGGDNEQYLNTDFYGSPGKWGSIFMDFRCEYASDNIIIYGHHMKDGTMFHDLIRYQDSAFFEEHKQIRLYQINGDEEVYNAIDVLYWDANASNGTTFYEHMSKLDYGGGKLLSLTTCDDTAGNSHMVLIALKS